MASLGVIRSLWSEAGQGGGRGGKGLNQRRALSLNPKQRAQPQPTAPQAKEKL